MYKAVFKIIADKAVKKAMTDPSSLAHGAHWNVGMVLNRIRSMDSYNRKSVNGTAEEVENAAKGVLREILNI